MKKLTRSAFVFLSAILFAFTCRTALAVDAPVGYFYATPSPSYYISIGSSGEISTNLGVYNQALLLGTWTPTGSLRRTSDSNFYFPASVVLHVGQNQSKLCTYYGKIELFVISPWEFDASNTIPSNFIGADGNCAFSGELSGTVPFKRN